MSRNKEKAQSALNRFHQYKAQEAGVLHSDPSLRPKYVQKVTSLPQAEKWRTTIISEISTKLTRIQDPTLNEFTIREINDDLNRLFKEKRAWEYHIRELGGNDYLQLRDMTSSGISIKGYRYFGRAKELEDVKKLIEANKKEERKGKGKGDEKKQLQNEERARENRIDYSYYGYFDEIDGDEEDNDPLLMFEQKRSRELAPASKGDTEDTEAGEMYNFDQFPTNEEVSKWLVDRKRQQLLAKLGIQE
ncbi:Pre-mRNA-splicing factor [Spathaspora sp. JA1]|nr:Pre-mRNA-splicing factor [Spathaspora sp. JA1]